MAGGDPVPKPVDMGNVVPPEADHKRVVDETAAHKAILVKLHGEKGGVTGPTRNPKPDVPELEALKVGGPGELKILLSEYGIDVNEWGHGKAKTVDDLMEELNKGETKLVKAADGKSLIRELNVVSIRIINAAGDVLVETHQTLKDGGWRHRFQLPAEKMIAGENIPAATVRGVMEEFGNAASEVTVDAASQQTVIKSLYSPSYPGLMSTYFLHVLDTKVAGMSETDFYTWEDVGGGQGTYHYWVWYNVPQWELLERERIELAGNFDIKQL